MPRPMGPRGGKAPETSKDFKGSIKRLFSSLNNFKYVVIFALVLGFVSAIITLVTPNKLSELTNILTKGISPNINEEVIKNIITTQLPAWSILIIPFKASENTLYARSGRMMTLEITIFLRFK